MARQTEMERAVVGVLLGVVLGAIIGLLARDEPTDGGRWAARSRT